jgi:transposase
MARSNRKFSSQFKAEAVQLVLDSGRPIAHVAGELGVNPGTLRYWVTLWSEANNEPRTVLSPVERAHVSDLETENQRLRLENEFLKKAAAFFAQTSQ